MPTSDETREYRRSDDQPPHPADANAHLVFDPRFGGAVTTPRVLAAATLAALPLVIPAAASGAGTPPDSYTVATDLPAALPGSTVHVTATDGAASSTGCANSPYSLALTYPTVSGTDASTTVSSGTTDAADGHVDTSFTVPNDAASTDASNKTATLNLTVTCGTPAQPAGATSTASASLTVSAYSGQLKLSGKWTRPGNHVEVLLGNCRGGPMSSTFNAQGKAPTTVAINDYNPTTLEASGGFQVPTDVPGGQGSVSAQCWQTNYDPALLNVVEVLGERAGSGSAPPAQPVAATPTFTG